MGDTSGQVGSDSSRMKAPVPVRAGETPAEGKGDGDLALKHRPTAIGTRWTFSMLGTKFAIVSYKRQLFVGTVPLSGKDTRCQYVNVAGGAQTAR